MSLYKNNFGFREPYQILLDGTFCQVALAHKVNIQEQLPKYLSGTCKLLTTACVVEETRRLGMPLNGAYRILSQFPLHNCGHDKPISASKCLSSFIIDNKNKDHYLVATQDYQLRVKISKYAVCPVIKLANNALVVEKPTQKVQSKVARTHHFLANKISDDEHTNLKRLKEGENLLEAIKANGETKKKKKGPKGPNPLSCKKKRNPTTGSEKRESEDEASSKRRKRKKPKLSRHVKRLLSETAVEPGKPSEIVSSED